MLLPKFVAFLAALGTLAGGQRSPRLTRQSQTDVLQNIVTWDQYSLIINGTRVDVFSGEIHPFRLPVPSLYLDVLQKVKSLGFSAISAYFFWGLHEPKRGAGISFEGFRDLQPFFDAAKKAGLYVIARPGPYINAEVTGGGFPGWGTHTSGLWRTSNASYVEAYTDYMTSIGKVLAKNQITNGGPIILVQVENEYSGFQAPYTEDFEYEANLKSIMRSSGVTVPLTVNDAWPGSHYTNVDIYGYDSYPNGFDCSHPDVWLSDAVPEYFWGAHLGINPQAPNAVYEFQGGAFDPWGGFGYESCAQLLGPAFERVFYKNQFAMASTVLNFYMLYGGTNWGGIAHPGVYTSYDYGSAIAEDRTLREKAYELKLQAYFRSVSPAFLTSQPTNIFATQGSFTGNQALKTTQLLDFVGNKTAFYVVRQTDASVNDDQTYSLTLPTSIGQLTIPTIGGSLALNGKDSKIHVVDYSAGSTTVLYSTGEILTWATIDSTDVILVYGNKGELHETAFKFGAAIPTANVVSGAGKIKTKLLGNGGLALQYVTSGQTVVRVGNVLLYILDRANAYDFWVLNPATAFGQSFVHSTQKNPIIVKGGYLLRSVTASAGALQLTGDFNTTQPVTFEIIAPQLFQAVSVNGAKLALAKTPQGTLTGQRAGSLPPISLPNLASLPWKTADSLPEIQPQYSDASWTVADHKTTVNPTPPNTTVVLYAGDYGFHTGSILWRHHFAASGLEKGFNVGVQGGAAFGFSVWLDQTFIGSWKGDGALSNFNGTFSFPSTLSKDSQHVLTILQDHMGNEENWWAAGEVFKTPRGILSYSFVGTDKTASGVWKVAGNLGGEDYIDTTRGALNEGGLFGERQGWHLPGFNDASWVKGSPMTGLRHAGVAFYRTTFTLDIPAGVDYPMALVFTNATATTAAFRAQLFVNGYQFGKYVNNIGPQKSFPVPQGILNYNGQNTLAVSLWALDAAGGHVDSLRLVTTARVESSMGKVANAPSPGWVPRVHVF